MPMKLISLPVDIKIEGRFEKRIGFGYRLLVIYIDDQEQLKSVKPTSSLPLRWQKDYHM